MRRIRLVSLAVISCFALTSAGLLRAQTPADGTALLQRMHDAYAGKWYSTLTFAQKTTVTRQPGTTSVSTWHESLRYTPSTGVQLRIDIGDLAAGNGMLYTADSTWVVRGGKLSAARGTGNEFLPLIEGVYMQPVSRTAAEITKMHVDLSRIHAGTWRNRPVWVVGTTSAADTTTPQFWVDQERNVVVRAVIQPNSTTTMDIALDGYEPVGPAWLATKITMAVNGRVIQTEEYSDWKTNVPLPAALFEVASWTSAPHWARK